MTPGPGAPIEVPVVLMSGYRSPESRELGGLQGIHYLGKPATPRAILAALGEALTKADA